jgi:SSS family solute:Na+ symporter
MPLELPWMDQMLYTFLITVVVIMFVSLSTNKLDDDPKAIHVTSTTFKTGPAFNIAAYVICIILVVLYTVFW